MKIRYDFIMLGVVAIIAGIKMLFTGHVWSAPITPMAASLVCGFGVIVVIWGVFGGKIIGSDKTDLMICKNCKITYKSKAVSIAICPKCQGELEKSNKIR